MKDNKLIAEFMGHEPIVKGDDVYYELNDIRLTSADDLRYHNSWDWLMPVIENIDHLQYAPVKGIEDALSTRHIGDTHKAVVEFIKEHNDEQHR